MPLLRETEIPSVVLALVLAPIVVLMVIMKWKAAKARKAQIRKLLILAAEEADKVEDAAAVEYSYSSTAINRHQQCAVCFSPTTSRCSKCKAVRYCSGKCQIIHWRQGHKQECQPLDIYGSSTSVSYVIAPCSEPDSKTLSETQELRSLESSLQEPSTCGSMIQRLNRYSSVTPETCASETADVLISGPEVRREISDPEVPKEFSFVPGAIVTSNVDPLALNSSICLSNGISTPVVSTENAPISDIPGGKIQLPDVPTACSVSSPTVLCSREVNTLNCKISMADDPAFRNTVNVIRCSTDNTLNICNSLVCDPPVTISSLDNPTGSQIFECEAHNSLSFMPDLSTSSSHMSDLPTPNSPGKNHPDSQSPAYDVPSSKSSLENFSSTRNHVVDAPRSRSSIPVIDSDTSQQDVPGARSSANNISSSGTSGFGSSCLKSSLSCNSSLRSSSISSDCGSSSSSITFKFQTSLPNEVNAPMPVAEIQSAGISASCGRSKRSSGTTQHCSPHRERVSIFGDSSQNTGSINGESMNAEQIVGSHFTTNDIKKLEKKIAKQPKLSKALKQTSAGRLNGNPGKSSKILFPYEYFIKLFNWDKLDLPPRGLINCGNSCYANVVLQCLKYTRPLAAYLLQGFHSEECQRKDWCLMCELEYLVSRVRGGEIPLSPIRILSRIRSIGNHLGYGRQEDAHEFLRFAIDNMQSICLDEAGGEKVLNPTEHSTTFIQQIFSGYLQSKVKCNECQHESNRYDLMMDLTVEVHGNIESLEDALTQFTAPELLDGENKYKCDRCKSYVKAQKWLTVHEAPNILTIALKRFQTGNFGKLNKLIAFPEVLDMLPYMSGTGDKPPLYKLYAVVVHLDMLNASFFGHYICYVKDLQGAWYKIDDSKVNPVGLDTVMSEGAYMLLYSRSSPRPPAVVKDGMEQTCTEVPLNHCCRSDAEQSSSSNVHDEDYGVHTRQFPSLDFCTAARINGNHSAKAGNLDFNAHGIDSSNAVNLDGFGFNCDRASSITGERNRISVPMDSGDLPSSDAGSLFSGSDETSCSTDSNRDSTSTVDYTETVTGDSGYPPWSSSSLSECCGVSKSSSCPPETDLGFEDRVDFVDSSFYNQQHGKRRIDQGFSPPSNSHPLNNGRLTCPSNSSSSLFCCPSSDARYPLVSDLSSRRKDMLDCRMSYTNRYEHSMQSPQFRIPESGNYPIDSPSEDFAAQAKRKHIKQKHMSKETENLKFHVPSGTCNAANNFEHCLVHDPRTSAISTVHSLGFER